MFSLIFINYNSFNLIIENIQRLLKKKENKQRLQEIIIVNNGENTVKKDKIQKTLQRFKKEFRQNIIFITNKRNLGFARACNKGAKIAKGNWLFFLNPDCFLLKATFDSFYQKRNKPQMGVLAPVVLNSSKLIQKWSFGICGNWGKRIIFYLKEKFSSCNEFYINKKETEECFWVTGACFMIKKSIFWSVGGFDSKFFLYFEDRDLCFRLRKKGYKIYRLMNKTVIHKEGQSKITSQDRKRLYYCSEDYYIQKHYGFFIMKVLKILRFPVFWKNIYLK